LVLSMSSQTFSALLLRLHGVRKSARGYIARCPSHDDQRASLSLRETSDGTTLLRCFAGCSAQDIVRALNLELRDLFPTSLPLPTQLKQPSRTEIDRIFKEELATARSRRVADRPWSNPRTTIADQNVARRRTNLRCGTVFPQLAEPWWSELPHANDPAWGFCVERAIFELSLQRQISAEWVKQHAPKFEGMRSAIIERAAVLLHEIGRDSACRET
jgi:hypothetical protein